MAKKHYVFSESRVHQTPAGRVRSEILYSDDLGQPADKSEATRCEILEYDEKGAVICSTIGVPERKQGSHIL